MLHDGHLLQHLSLVHLQHPTIHLAPIRHSADIIDHGRMLRQVTLLHFLHKSDAGKIEILIREIVKNVLIVNGLGLHIFVIHQLRRPEYKGKKMVIVKPPNPM